MNKPLISIIIPIYNRVNLLPKVLQSIKNQTYKNIEVIIVDDGSQPAVHSSQFLFHSRDLSIKLIRQENMGAPVARNRGLSEAEGEYVIFWDADVIGRPDMLDKMYEILQENSDVSYAYSNFQFSIFKKKMLARGFNLDELKKNNFIHSTSLIRRRDVIKWDESLKRFQDWDLWLSMSEEGKNGVWVDEYLFTVLGGGTMSGWLPRIAYIAPFKYFPAIARRVKNYTKAKEIVQIKYNLK